MLAMSKTDVLPGSTETQQLRVMVPSKGVSFFFFPTVDFHHRANDIELTGFSKTTTSNSLYSKWSSTARSN